jgi:cytochrome c oxidase subunit IV
MMAQRELHDDEYTHVVPASLYVGIWAALMVLTLTTVLASFAELGPFNIVVALLIATIKGTLVVLFFMHLRYSPKLTIAAVIAALFWLFIMFSLTMTDYLSRGWSTFAGR